MTERHDVEEDRDNDVVTHDNPNHESHHTYETHLEESDDRIQNWEEDTKTDDGD